MKMNHFYNLKGYIRCLLYPKKSVISFMIPSPPALLLDTFYIIKKHKGWRIFEITEYIKNGKKNIILSDKTIKGKSVNLWKTTKSYKEYLMTSPPPELSNCLYQLYPLPK